MGDFFDFKLIPYYHVGMTCYFDAHCHIQNIATAECLATGDAPVYAINNAAQISDWGMVIQIANNCPNVFGAIGIHPWYVSDLPVDWDAQLHNALVANPKLMIGEIGLDKLRGNIALQLPVFTRQLDLAYELSRGVHIHCVDAFDTLLPILCARGEKLPPFILFHRYGGNPMNIERLAREYNAYFSYRAGDSVRRILATPSDRILTETDGDNPTKVVETSKQIAAIRNDTSLNFYNNTMKMLGL